MKRHKIKSGTTVYFGLIVTWDVLKHLCVCVPEYRASGLIVTWDVLKPRDNPRFIAFDSGLIVTWDVLKRNQRAAEQQEKRINSNMRCIETCRQPVIYPLQDWLIVTWDVLKLNSQHSIRLRRTRLIVTWDVLKQDLGDWSTIFYMD